MDAVNNKHFKNKKMVFRILVVFILVLLVAIAYLNHDSKKSTFANTPTTKNTNANTRPSISSNQGGVNNTPADRKTIAIPPKLDWTSSSGGNIVLQKPSANSLIRSGDYIVGVANVSDVQFILTDASVGLIDQGSMKVVDGKFLGTFLFKSHATTGKLEVYYADPINGAEKDIVSIKIAYGS